jgi:hypothetical protein
MCDCLGLLLDPARSPTSHALHGTLLVLSRWTSHAKSGVAERGRRARTAASGCSKKGPSRSPRSHTAASRTAARSLGHPQPGLEVMAPPDQGRRHSDPHQGSPRDRPHSVLRHEAAESGPRGLRARLTRRCTIHCAPGARWPLAMLRWLRRSMVVRPECSRSAAFWRVSVVR